MKKFSLTNWFSAAGLAMMVSAPAADAAPACNASPYYNADDLAGLAHNDPATIRILTADIVRGTVEHAFDKRAAHDAFLQQSKKTLLKMTERLPNASAAERSTMAKDAYKLRLTLESRNFAYHYAMAAQTVSMAAEPNMQAHIFESSDKDVRSLERALSGLNSTMIYDLRRVLNADMHKPLAEVVKEADTLCVGNEWRNNKWMLLDTIGRAKATREEQTVIAKAVSHLKPL